MNVWDYLSSSKRFSHPLKYLFLIFVTSFFRFLLEDLTQKIESIFGVHKFGSVSEIFQNITFPANFLCDVIEVLPTLIKQFELISKHLRAIVNASIDTEISDSDDFEFTDDLFSDEANLVKMCFGLCIRLVAALFSWPGFEDEIHKTMLKSNHKKCNQILSFANTNSSLLRCH